MPTPSSSHSSSEPAESTEPTHAADGTGEATSLKQQLFRFVAVGIFTAAIDYTITMVLTFYGPRPLAKAVGWTFGTIAAYLLNSKYTFNAKVSGRKATAVFVLYASTFGVQWILWQITPEPLEAIGLHGFWMNTASFVFAQAVATITNFVLQRVLIFRETSGVNVVEESKPTRD